MLSLMEAGRTPALLRKGFQKLFRVGPHFARHMQSLTKALSNLPRHRPAHLRIQARAAFKEGFNELQFIQSELRRRDCRQGLSRSRGHAPDRSNTLEWLFVDDHSARGVVAHTFIFPA